MNISENGLELIKSRESCVLKIYTDRAGKKTVGWGHMLTPHELLYHMYSNGITQDAADALLVSDLAWVEASISEHIQAELNQYQFDALCSLVYNCGPSPLRGTLGRQLNNDDYRAAGRSFLMWCHVGSQVDADLLSRRKEELDLWSREDGS